MRARANIFSSSEPHTHHAPRHVYVTQFAIRLVNTIIDKAPCPYREILKRECKGLFWVWAMELFRVWDISSYFLRLICWMVLSHWDYADLYIFNIRLCLFSFCTPVHKFILSFASPFFTHLYATMFYYAYLTLFVKRSFMLCLAALFFQGVVIALCGITNQSLESVG